MGWSLNGPKTTVRWSKRKIFGREDFPEEGQLSRKHFEVVERKGRVYVQDLSSRNGTFIYGQQVKTGEAIEIQPGDSIKVGDSSFTLHAVEDFAPIGVDLGLFAILTLIAFSNPNYAWGAAIGLTGSLVVLCLLLTSFVTVAMTSNFIIIRVLGKFWNKKTYSVHAAAVFAFTLVLHLILITHAEQSWETADTFNQSKIEYFCMTRFNEPRCIKLMKRFPSAAAQLDKWKLDLIAEKFKGRSGKNSGREN
jgi:hypothetical protein